MNSLVEELLSLGEPEESQPMRLEDFSRARSPLMTKATPRHELQKEQPWHRTCAWMLAKGFTRREIAEAVDKTEATITLATQQGFMRQMVADIIAELNLQDESAFNLLRAAQTSAAQTVISLASSASSETVKMRAAQEILDRVLGRPVQFVNTQKTNPKMDPKDEAEALKREIERLQPTIVTNHITQNNLYGGNS